MTEQEIYENIENEVNNEPEVIEAEVEEVQEEQLEPMQQPEVSEAEAQARSHGWVGKDEWIAQGKPADDWRDHHFFNLKGEMISEIKKQERKMKERLAQNNAYHETNLKLKLGELQAQKREAVELADVDKVNEIDAQISNVGEQLNNITQEVNEVAQEDKAHEDKWAESNAWINGQDPKGVYGRDLINKGIQQGLAGNELTSYIERGISSQFPPQNPRREAASVTDKAAPRQPAAKQALTMNSLTSEERMIVESMKNMDATMTDKQLLKIVKDSRERG